MNESFQTQYRNMRKRQRVYGIAFIDSILECVFFSLLKGHSPEESGIYVCI